MFRPRLRWCAGLAALFFLALARAQDGAPFTLPDQFSATITLAMQDGTTMMQKMFMSGDKVRSEMDGMGLKVITILRPDEQKIYTVMPGEKMVMEMAYDPRRIAKTMGLDGFRGTFDLLGPETSDGVVCTKYKVTSFPDKKVFYMWVNPVTRAPVKMTSQDGTLTAHWTNYQPGPQDDALFEPPADCPVTTLPPLPALNGGH